MVIDEAIKILSHLPLNHHYNVYKEDDIAIKLGIEALKQIKLDRRSLLPFRSTLLLGDEGYYASQAHYTGAEYGL